MSSKPPKPTPSQLRIIGGEWRSRVIEFAPTPGLRPTPNRVRETLFNWLQWDVAGSRCLDLFSGSGALGFEAASRGAKQVTQVESNPLNVQHLRQAAQKLNAAQVQVVQQDVLSYLAQTAVAEPYSLVFLDPPFAQDLIVPTCELLEQNGWLAMDARIYVEAETAFNLEQLPANWSLLKSKIAGEVRYALYRRHAIES